MEQKEIKTFTEFMRTYPFASGNAQAWCWDAWKARNEEVDSLKAKIVELEAQLLAIRTENKPTGE
jgi:hypothetical protein